MAIGEARLRRVATALALAPALSGPGACQARAPDFVTPEMFGAVGNGVADDTEAWRRAAQSGRPIHADRSYRISGPIVLTARGASVTGAGELIATAGLVGQSLLESRGEDCLIQGLGFANPGRSQSRTGPISVAIRISADRCRVLGNRIDGFQNGIVVSAEGEFFDTLIQSNIVRNVVGAGGGPRDVHSTSGEDRGDGIVSWGARTRILDNQVSALPGTDARIGIHVEAMSTYKRRPATPADETGAEIARNRVEGPFRRGIVDEGVNDVVIHDNELAGGYAWWGIAATGLVTNVRIVHNRIRFDRSPSNLRGAAWSFWPAAIQVYGGPGMRMQRVAVENNEVYVSRCGGPALQYMNDGSQASGFGPLTVRGNRLETTTPCDKPAIYLVGGTRLTADARNDVRGRWTQALGTR